MHSTNGCISDVQHQPFVEPRFFAETQDAGFLLKLFVLQRISNAFGHSVIHIPESKRDTQFHSTQHRNISDLFAEADSTEAVILFACFHSMEIGYTGWVSEFDKPQPRTMVQDILECFLIPI